MQNKSLESMSLCLLLVLCSSPLTIKLALKFKDFPVPTAIFKDFQGLEFSLNIQGLSRIFKVRANPGVWILGVWSKNRCENYIFALV